MDMNWIILGVITLGNIGLAWVSKSYAQLAQEACKACIARMQQIENDHDT
jgi:hypothetical protein